MNAPALYDDAKRAVAQLLDVASAKIERDKAQALETYARLAQDRDLIARACEFRVRAERRVGELLIEMAERGERRRPGQRSQRATAALKKLDDLGVNKTQSSRWQELARLDEREFEGRIVERRRQALSAIDQSRAEKQAEKKASRAARESALGEKQRALPDKRYGVIYADPEWRFEVYSRENGMDRAADNHYPTSALDEICARDVGAIAADDCALFLWVTTPMLANGGFVRVLDAWGFEGKSCFVWGKDRVGTGYWTRDKAEHLIIATRGHVPSPAMGDQFESLQMAPVGPHSAKPEIFLEIIESYFPSLPKIELNRRGPARPGWDAWGNESEGE